MQPLTETQVSLRCPHDSATGPFSEPDKSSS